MRKQGFNVATPIQQRTTLWLERQVRPHITANTQLWVGFSGGLDSTVLLHLLAQHPWLKPRVRALYVHHGISANADAWLAHCQAQCQAWGIPFQAEHVQLVRLDAGLEEAAREARYQAYAQHVQAQDILCLGHHGDDQLETFMMRFSRGSGLQGLAGIPSKRLLENGSWLVRPLLNIARDELQDYAQQQQLTWVEDESNTDVRYERNFWRARILPEIWQRFPKRKAVALRTVQQLQQDAQVLQQLLAPHVEQTCVTWTWPFSLPLACDLTALAAQPAAVQPYVVKAWLAELGLMLPSAQWLEQLFAQVIQAQPQAQPQLALGNYSLYRFQNKLFVTDLGKKMPAPLSLAAIGEYAWRGERLKVQPAALGLASQSYQVVAAQQCYAGVMILAGRPSKTVKALLQEAGIPVALRKYWPVVRDGDNIAAVAGVALAENYCQSGGWQLELTSNFMR